MPEQDNDKPVVIRPGPATATLAVFFVHLVYMMVGIYKFRADREWLFAPHVPFWGIALAIVAYIATAAVCMYVVVAGATALRIVWVAAVVTTACVGIGKAAEGTILAMATTVPQVLFFALAECLLILPLLCFATFPPKAKRTQ